MKRQTILLLLSVLLLSGGAAAQSTKEQTLEDLTRTAALYYCYENHPRAAATRRALARLGERLRKSARKAPQGGRSR